MLHFYFLSRGLKYWVGREEKIKWTRNTFNEFSVISMSQTGQNTTSVRIFSLILQKEGMPKYFEE